MNEALRQWVHSYWVTYVRMSRRERRNLIEVLNDVDTHSFVEVERPGAQCVDHHTIAELVALAELMEAARQAVLRRQRYDDPVLERLAAAVLAMDTARRSA